MASTGTRLRRTFRYPSDSEGSDGARDELDEEEQDQIISTLTQQSTRQNSLYTFLITLLPLFLCLPFILNIPTSPLLSVLGITSLLITAGHMRISCAPPPPTPAQPRTPCASPPRPRRYTHPAYNRTANPGHSPSPWLQLTEIEQRLFVDAVPEDGPLRKTLPLLNVAACVVLAVTGLVLYWTRSSRTKGKGGGGGGGGGVKSGEPDSMMWVICLLPAFVRLVVESAVRSVRDVEEGIGELDRLRYPYKGA